MLTLQDKIDIINNSDSLEKLQHQGIMPDPESSNGYFFVSYSHKDYKQVFCMILRLMEQGVKLWYDRGLETGRSWLNDVRRRIYPYDCKGVIIFLSDNCIGSQSLLNEYNLAKRYKKRVVVVDIDSNSDEDNAMTDINMSEEQIEEMLVAFSYDKDYAPAKKVFATGKYELLKAVFSNRIHRVLSSDDKIDIFLKTLKTIPVKSLLKYKKCDTLPGKTVSRINDITVRSIVLPQTISKKGGEENIVRGIEKGCFANCVYLETLSMPENWEYILEYAFYNCERLRALNLGAPKDAAIIYMNAFDGCISLKNLYVPRNINLSGGAKHIEIIQFEPDSKAFFHLGNSDNLKKVILPSAYHINEEAFECCSNLEDFNIPLDCRRIGRKAFYGCTSLKKLVFPQEIGIIEDMAFYNCSSLKKVLFQGMQIEFGNYAFARCSGLTNVSLNAKQVGNYCFAECKELTDVTIKGDKLRLGKNIFDKCDKINSVTLSAKVVLPEFGDINPLGIYPVDSYCGQANIIYLSSCKAGNMPTDAFKPIPSDKQGYLKFVRR